ncbi:MAG: ribosome-associated translation inhibitor RaiA [Aggregatilineales bacterium]
MDVTIHGLNLKVTEGLEAYARKKLDRLDRYLPNITDIRVELSEEHTRRGENLARAQITVRHKRGAILRAEERVNGDIEAALALAVDNMYRRIERFKGKRSRKGRERFTATVEELSIAEALPETSPAAEEPIEEPELPVKRRKQVIVTPMTEEEAVEQMELLGHTFFMFLNGATGTINVIYKRRAGDYGILIPQPE